MCGQNYRKSGTVPENTHGRSWSAVTSDPPPRHGYMTCTDHTELVRLGAQYLRAYSDGDAVSLYRLADTWGASDLCAATCEIALVVISATAGPRGVDTVFDTFHQQ